MLPIIIAKPTNATPIPCIIFPKFFQLGSFKYSNRPIIAYTIPAITSPSPIDFIASNPNFQAVNPTITPLIIANISSLWSTIHCNQSGISPSNCDKSKLGIAPPEAPPPPPPVSVLSCNTFISSKPANCLFNSFACFVAPPNSFFAPLNLSTLAPANKSTPNHAFAI